MESAALDVSGYNRLMNIWRQAELELRAAEILSLDICSRRAQVATHIWRAWALLARLYFVEGGAEGVLAPLTKDSVLPDLNIDQQDCNAAQFRQVFSVLAEWYPHSLESDTELNLGEQELNSQLDILSDTLDRCRRRLSAGAGILRWYQSRMTKGIIAATAVVIIGFLSLYTARRLSEPYQLRLVSQSWGTLGTDRSVDGATLGIGSQEFLHGLGTHAESKIELTLRKNFRSFSGGCGVDRETNGAGSIECTVLVDGVARFTSGRLTGRDSMRRFDIALENPKIIELVVSDAGDGMNSDHADWVDLQFTTETSPVPQK